MSGASFASLLMAGAIANYQVARSLRFRGSNSANLNRTFAGLPSVRTKGHLHFCVKRGTLGTDQRIMESYDGASTNDSLIRFTSGDLLEIGYGGTSAKNIITTRVFRDPTAFYIIDIAFDTTDVTNTNRIKVWVNGVQETSFGTANWPAQNDVHQFTYNSANNRIASIFGGGSGFFDGYLAEFIWIDGIPKIPGDFGILDSVLGVWTPTAYGGAYGTNGFKLNFSNNSAATAAAIGADSSGNGNNWTPSGISVTTGVTNDSVCESPTNYGIDSGNGDEVRGNYCVFNPLVDTVDATYTEANLRIQTPNANAGSGRGTFGMQSGKWYWEYDIVSVAVGCMNGICLDVGGAVAPWASTVGYAYYSATGNRYGLSTNVAYGASYTAGDRVGIAFDADLGAIWFSKNGSWVTNGAASSAALLAEIIAGTVTHAAYSSIPMTAPWFPMVSDAGGGVAVIQANFGQRPYITAAPTGFKALCSQNLAIPAIVKGNTYFDTNLRTGTGAAFNVTGKSFQPDFVWSKGRSGATSNIIYDGVRTATKQIVSDTIAAETTEATGLTAFNSDGFSGGALAAMNTNTATYIDWLWKKGLTPGLDIITFTMGGAGTTTVAHALGVIPSFVITKGRGSITNWHCWHKNLTNSTNSVIDLNVTAAVDNSTVMWGTGFTNANLLFTVGNVYAAGVTVVAYAFSDVIGFSKFGTYIGNGAVDGLFVHCGFRPRFILVKRTDAVSDWYIWDTARDTMNPLSATLLTDSAGAETSAVSIDILSNGFKLRSATVVNVNTGTYIFAAFAETPFTYARAR